MSQLTYFTYRRTFTLAATLFTATLAAPVQAQYLSSERVFLNRSVPAPGWDRGFATLAAIPGAEISNRVEGATAMLGRTSAQAEWQPEAVTLHVPRTSIDGERALLGRLVPARARHEGGE